MTDYKKQADDFAKRHGIELFILGKDYRKRLHTDKEERWVFKCRLTRNGKKYTFDFGQSIMAGATPPDMYDVLSCLEKYGYDNFEDFCSELGYDTDSRTAERIYNAVEREYAAVERLFGDIIDELREIQ